MDLFSRGEVEYLILGCAREIDSLEAQNRAYVETLIELGPVAQSLSLEDSRLGFCVAAELLQKRQNLARFTPDLIDRLCQASKAIQNTYMAVPRILAAAAIFNVIQLFGSDPDLADRMLAELRDLSSGIDDDVITARRVLAMGLTNAIFHSAREFVRVDGLLDELAELYARYGKSDASLMRSYAMGATSAVFLPDEDCDRLDEILANLRKLYDRHGSTDEVVRAAFAHGTFNVFNYSDRDSTRAKQLFEVLSWLYVAYGKSDAAVRYAYAKGYGAKLMTYLDAGEIGHQIRLRVEYEELRRLSKAHDDDVEVIGVWDFVNDRIN